MEEKKYIISQAAKLVEEEAHVLRFWENKLSLPIKRNSKGHRYYTREDIQIFLSIKELKRKGFSLEKITSIIPQLYGRAEEIVRDEDTISEGTTDKAIAKEVEDKLMDDVLQEHEEEKEKLEVEPQVESEVEDHVESHVEPQPQPFEPAVPIAEDSNENDRIAKREQFAEIMERLIQEVQSEKRCSSLDREIRARQVNRKMVAATKEDKTKKRRIFRFK